MATPELPSWMLNMSPEQFAQLQEEQFVRRRCDEIFAQAANGFMNGMGDVPAFRPRRPVPHNVGGRYALDAGDTHIRHTSYAQRQPASLRQHTEEPGYATDYPRGPALKRAHYRNSSSSVAPPPHQRQASFLRGHQRSRGVSVHPEVVDLTEHDENLSVKDEDVEVSADAGPAQAQTPLPIPFPTRGSAQGRSPNADATSKRRSRSAGDISRPRKKPLRITDILQAPRVQEALQSKGYGGNGRARSEKEFSEEYDDGGLHNDVAQDLPDRCRDLPSACGDDSDAGYPAAATTGADRLRHKNPTGAYQTFAPSLHHPDSMPYAVPPLLRTSSSIVATTPRQRRKNLSVSRGGAASSATHKNSGRAGVCGHRGIRQTSLHPQSTQSHHHQGPSDSPKFRLGRRIPFQQEFSSAASSSNSQRKTGRVEEGLPDKPVITSLTPFTAGFEQARANEHSEDGEMETFDDEMWTSAQKKVADKIAAEKEIKEQRRQEAEQRLRARHDPFPEEIRVLGKQVERKEGEKRAAEAEGNLRHFSRSEGRARQRIENERKQKEVELVDEAANRAKKLKELQARAINKAKAVPVAVAHVGIDVQNRHDSFHLKFNGESRVSSGLSRWANSSAPHATSSHQMLTERLTPQHVSPSPVERLPNGRAAINREEPLVISSDESSSAGESEDEEVSTPPTPRSCLKRPLDRSDADASGPSTSNKKVCVLTPREEAEIGSTVKRRIGGSLPKPSIEALHHFNQHQIGRPCAENSMTPDLPTTAKTTSRADSVSRFTDSNDGIISNSTTTSPKTSVTPAINGHAATKNEENPLFVSETSGSDQSVDDEKQEHGQITPEQREKNEKAARRRWKKKAAEKREKGEDPGVFVYKPRSPPKKPNVQAGEENATSATATIEAKEKDKPKRVSKPKPNAVIHKIKQNVHQKAIERSSLFGEAQTEEDTPSSSNNPNQESEVEDTTPIAQEHEQTSKNEDVEMKDDDDSLNDLFEETEGGFDSVTKDLADHDVTMQAVQDEPDSVAVSDMPLGRTLPAEGGDFVPTGNVEKELLPNVAIRPQANMRNGAFSGCDEISESPGSETCQTSPPTASAELDSGELDSFFNDDSETISNRSATIVAFKDVSLPEELGEHSRVGNGSKSKGFASKDDKSTEVSTPLAFGKLPPDRKFKRSSSGRAREILPNSVVEIELQKEKSDPRPNGFLAQLPPLKPVKDNQQIASTFTTTFTDGPIKPVSAYEIDLSAPDELENLDADQPPKPISHVPAQPRKPIQSDSGQGGNIKSSGVPVPFSVSESATDEVNRLGENIRSTEPSSSPPSTTSDTKISRTINFVQSTVLLASTPTQSTKISERNGRALPKIKKFLKKPVDHWVWAEAKQFLENGRCEPKDLIFFMNNRNTLQDMLELKKEEADYEKEFRSEPSDEDEPSGPNTITTAVRPLPKTRKVMGRLSAPDIRDKRRHTNGRTDSAARKTSPITEHKPKKVPESTRVTSPPVRHYSLPRSSNGSVSSVRHSETPETSRRAPERRYHQERSVPLPPQTLHLPRSDPPTEDLPTPPKLGGKQINEAAIRAYYNEVEEERELSSQEASDEDQKDASRHDRESSPITEADEVHYEYTVKRKQWRSHEHEGDAEWFSVQAPFYVSRMRAERALDREKRVLFEGIAFDPLSHLRLVSERDIDDQLEWYAEMPKCSMRLRVDRRLRRKGDHKLPMSKEGWTPAKVWWIKKKTWRRYWRIPSPPHTPREASPAIHDEEDAPPVDEGGPLETSTDGNDGASERESRSAMHGKEQEQAVNELERDNNESEHTQSQRITSGDGDDDDENYELKYEGQEQHPDGVWTNLVHANKCTAEWYMVSSFDMESKRIDVVKPRVEAQDRIREERKRMNKQKKPLSIEGYSGDGTKKIRVWVEETSVNGPKNP